MAKITLRILKVSSIKTRKNVHNNHQGKGSHQRLTQMRNPAQHQLVLSLPMKIKKVKNLKENKIKTMKRE